MALSAWLFLGMVLFAAGAAVFMTRRSAIVMLCGAELMLNAANLTLVGFSRLDPTHADGQVFALFIMLVAAAEAAVLLAILFALSKHSGPAEGL